MDAEFFQARYLDFYARLRPQPALASLINEPIVHPAEIKRGYVDQGFPFVLAQNVRPILLDFGDVASISPDAADMLSQNRLQAGDVLLTRTGANFGDCCVYLGEPANAYASADCLVIHPRAVAGEYLAVYLNTRPGRALLRRGAYGSSQPHIAPPYLRTIPIVRLGKIEDKVARLVREAHGQIRDAKTLYPKAERLLLESMGFERTNLRNPLSYQTRLRHVQRVARLDAEYFQPVYERILSHVSRFKCLPLAEVTRRISNGKTPAAEEYTAEGPCVLKVDGLTNTGFIEECDAHVPTSWAVANPKGQVRKHDALMLCAAHHPSYIGKTGLLMRDLGPHARAVGELIIVRFNERIHPGFGCVYLNLPAIRTVVQRLVRGNTAHLYPDDLSLLPVPLLPEDLQQQIGGLLERAYSANQRSRGSVERAKRLVESAVGEVTGLH
jgi:hypothetical protein